MPVVSPRRFSTSSSTLTSGSYRSTLGTSSSLDRPYYNTTNSTYITPRVSIRTSYTDSMFRDNDSITRERKNSTISEYSRSYSRGPSITESDSGISTSSRFVTRSDRSVSRGRSPSSSRSECGDTSRRRTTSNSSNSTFTGQTALDFYNKYSPNNYVPLPQRLNAEIARSRSISADIGKPPASVSALENRFGRRNNQRNTIDEKSSRDDDNGNDLQQSVAEIRKLFDPNMTVTRLPTVDPFNKYDSYINQLKTPQNGSITGKKVVPKDEKIVPVHMPNIFESKVVTNGTSPHKSRSPVNSVRSQLGSNNTLGRILEKSTTVYNGDFSDTSRNYKDSRSSNHVSEPQSYVRVITPKTTKITNDDAAKSPITELQENEGTEVLENGVSGKISFIDGELDETSPTDYEGAGFENKTFEHEHLLKIERNGEDKRTTPVLNGDATVDECDAASPVLNVANNHFPDEELNDISSSKESSPLSSFNNNLSALSVVSSSAGTTAAGGLNGLRNIGNTCFMNSVLQCLSNTRPLLEYVERDAYMADINTSLSCMKGALIKAFAVVIKELWRSGARDSVVNTTALKSQIQRFAPRFMGYSQQDAQEFLRYLLEGLHEDVNRVTTKPKPILTDIDESLSDAAKAQESWRRYLRSEDSRVSDIFVGQLKSTLRCTHCDHDSVTFDPFWDLSLPIPSRTGQVRLQQCLAHFNKEEELDGDEKPTCSKCGVRRKCLKWFTVQKFPRILVIHLKRFSPLERFRGKLSVAVDFPLTGLDMTPYAAPGTAAPSYNLYAVSNHSGTTYSGHYTAYCKHPYSGDWHEYNDSHVCSVSSRSLVSGEAYLLFYELQ